MKAPSARTRPGCVDGANGPVRPRKVRHPLVNVLVAGSNGRCPCLSRSFTRAAPSRIRPAEAVARSVRGHERSPLVASQKSPSLARRVVPEVEARAVTVAVSASHRTARGAACLGTTTDRKLGPPPVCRSVLPKLGRHAVRASLSAMPPRWQARPAAGPADR
jgi:hypothetical protein